MLNRNVSQFSRSTNLKFKCKQKIWISVNKWTNFSAVEEIINCFWYCWVRLGNWDFEHKYIFSVCLLIWSFHGYFCLTSSLRKACKYLSIIFQEAFTLSFVFRNSDLHFASQAIPSSCWQLKAFSLAKMFRNSIFNCSLATSTRLN